jgi:hypothetical protein
MSNGISAKYARSALKDTTPQKDAQESRAPITGLVCMAAHIYCSGQIRYTAIFDGIICESILVKS